MLRPVNSTSDICSLSASIIDAEMLSMYHTDANENTPSHAMQCMAESRCWQYFVFFTQHASLPLICMHACQPHELLIEAS